MKVLITGSSGFSGRYLIRHIIREAKRSGSDIRIAGICRSGVYGPKSPVELFQADICKSPEISDAVSEIRPDYIIHLAGGRSGNPEELFQTNVSGTINILDAVRNHCDKKARFLYVSSSAVYGYAGEEPISENTPLRPVGEYGITKAAAEMAALSYYIRYDMNVSVVRPFNLLGPGQDESFVTGRIVSQANQLLKGERDNLSLYSVDSSRDFVDVRDAVSAYWRIISCPGFEKKCKGMIFNVGSGRSTSIASVISILEEISDRKLDVKLPKTLRPETVPSQAGDNSLIKKALGWNPEYSLKETLSDMLEFCEKKN